MPRPARNLERPDGFFHLYNRICGFPDEYPLQKRIPARRFWKYLRFYTKSYSCRLAGFILMGNHYHIIVEFLPFRRLERQELKRRARKLYGRWYRKKTSAWGDERWYQFNRKLFDVSELMHDLNGEYAKWFNRHKGRRGALWSDRYKHVELLSNDAVADTLIYIELNSVRAGLVLRPEQWRASSAYLRYHGKNTLLIPLNQLFSDAEDQLYFESYRSKLLLRGTEPGRENQWTIPEWVIRQEARRGFSRPGSGLKRRRLFVDGLALGSKSEVQRVIDHFRETGQYSRRRHPIPHDKGLFFTAREQRSHAFAP